MNAIKKCNKCNTEKSTNDFYPDKKTTDGLHCWCKLCCSIRAKEYRVLHKDKLKTHSNKWRDNNPDKIKAYNFDANVIIRKREYKRAWDRKAMLNPVHRLSNNIRGNMYQSLKGKKYGRRWEGLVGYTLEDLIKHLENKFTANISWDNYGTDWHVDHIKPKSWFKYESATDPLFKECWALSNLQPKLRLDNIHKGNRFIG